MEQNEIVQVRQVANGFIVTRPPEPNMTNDPDAHVFRSVNELKEFMENHFTHRGMCLESDNG